MKDALPPELEPTPAEAPKQPPAGDQRQADPASFAVALLVMAVLVIGGYFLIMKLGEMSRLQDCIMQGRTNCAPIKSR